MSDELCDTRFHMKAAHKGVGIEGYYALGEHAFHSVSVQCPKAGHNGRFKTDHVLWVGSAKFTSAAQASRFYLWVKEKDATKDIKDYTIGEIEILYQALFSKDAVVAAVGAAHAESVDSDSEQDKNEESAVDSDEDDESQGGEPAAKKRRIELVAATPAFGVAAAPVTPPGLVRVVEPAAEKKKGWWPWW
jgi:hypothetical protein